MRSLSISISSIFGVSWLSHCQVPFRFHAPRQWGMLLPVLLHVSGASCQHRIGSLPREWMIGSPHHPRQWMSVRRAAASTSVCCHNQYLVSGCESGVRVPQSVTCPHPIPSHFHSWGCARRLFYFRTRFFIHEMIRRVQNTTTDFRHKI